MKIVILGAGNVATHLAWALKDIGHEISQIYSRTQLSAETLAQQLDTDYCSSPALLKQADLYIYALSDNALETIISEVNIRSGIHIHTAGSVDLNIFDAKFDNFGVFYPLQTFSKDKDIDFSEVPIFVEGNNTAVTDTLFELAKSLTNKPFVATSFQRIRLHIAAVFACNFSNYFYTLASDILKSESIPFDIFHPLIQETASKIQTLTPVDAQTGPARRNDTDTMQKHLEMIEDEDLKKIYSDLSARISERYKK
jgi:predicted short-subunit dehydrogenase-like oxidoreductase (DUF2520 family)